MRTTAIIIFLLMAMAAKSQTVLLNVDRKEETKTIERGPNLKRFAHFFMRAAMVASPDKPGARIIYGPSVNLAFGVRRKFKIGRVYSLGFEIENQYTIYKLKQEAGKVLPDTILHNVTGRFDYSTLALGFYNRFNFDPGRGNYLGKFIDIGIAGEWHYSIKWVAKNDMPDGTLNKSITRHLGYVHNFNSKAYVRIGISHLSIYASYRLFDAFKSSYNYPELPALMAGIDLAVF